MTDTKAQDWVDTMENLEDNLHFLHRAVTITSGKAVTVSVEALADIAAETGLSLEAIQNFEEAINTIQERFSSR